MRKKTYSTNDIAKMCDVTINTVVNWMKDGSLKEYRTKGGHRRIKEKDLMDFLKEYNIPVMTEERILVVDDDPAIRSGLKQFLELEGYKVDVAYNGFRAGKIFQDKNHKLVILDLVMPGLDGFDVCKAIRESESGKQTKIILLTGYLSKANRQKAKKVGVDKYQAKPVDSESLLKEIKKLIR